MVTQENFLFTGTVADNIRFGKPDATMDEVVEAAKVIGAHDFIMALPDGYETPVEKRGSRLSAGQRQLVAFARAFLADPAVLILDEATSSLDIPSERLIQRALRTILADRTAIVIAQGKVDAEKRGIDVEQVLAERAKLNPAGRFGDPEEFGQACAFLCGAKSGFITGQNILLDGGAFPGTL